MRLSLYFRCEHTGFPCNSRLVRWSHRDTACVRSVMSVRQLRWAISHCSSCRHFKSATDVRPLAVTSKMCRHFWNVRNKILVFYFGTVLPFLKIPVCEVLWHLICELCKNNDSTWNLPGLWIRFSDHSKVIPLHIIKTWKRRYRSAHS